MNRLTIPAVLFISFCPLLVAQQPRQAASPSKTTPAEQQVAPSSAVNERILAIKNARTIRISSETQYLTVSTLERALMMQKNGISWA